MLLKTISMEYIFHGIPNVLVTINDIKLLHNNIKKTRTQFIHIQADLATSRV